MIFFVIVICVLALCVSFYFINTTNLFNPRDAVVLVRSAEYPEIYTHGVIFHLPEDPFTKHIITVSSYPDDWSQLSDDIEVIFFADGSVVAGSIVRNASTTEGFQTSGFSNQMFKLHEMIPAAAKSVELWTKDYAALQGLEFDFYAYSPSSYTVKPYKSGIVTGLSEQKDYLFIQADLPEYQPGLPAIIKKNRHLYLCGLIPGIENKSKLNLTTEGYLQLLSYDFIIRFCM